MIKTHDSIAVLLATLCSLALAAVPCHAQLFGGGGLLGGGGGGGLLGGGGGGFGGGGFGGGPALGGGGGFGGAPIMRPSRPIASQPMVPNFPASRPPFGGGPQPIIGGGPSIGSLPNPSRPIFDDRPIMNRPAAGNLPGGDRPILGNRPIANNLPSLSPPKLPGTVLPGPVLPGMGRPEAGQPSAPVTRDRLNEFLNPDRPIASQLPDRPVDLPGRPVLGDKPLLGNRPILGDRPIINQPIMPSFGEQFLREEVRREIVADRIDRAIQVRDRIRELYDRRNHPFVYWWSQMWTHHPVWSWWRVATPYRWANWSSVYSWCGYSGSYTQPVRYEYTDRGVYANEKQVVVDDQFSKQARELAAAGSQLLEQKIQSQEADQLEWLPLGVFALCKNESGDPTMFVQLAISREGIIAGSFGNTNNNENLSLQGGADRESSRLAFTIGDQDDVVVESGLYNVTEEQSGAMVHYQDDTRENWLLVKMPNPPGERNE